MLSQSALMVLLLVRVLVQLVQRKPARYSSLQAGVVQLDVHRAQDWRLGKYSLLVNHGELYSKENI